MGLGGSEIRQGPPVPRGPKTAMIIQPARLFWNQPESTHVNPRTRRRFDEQFEWVLERMPPLIHELIERVPLHVEDHPSEEVMDQMDVEYIDDLCGLYTGIPIGEKSVTHSGTLPDVVTIYREGILSAAADDEGRIHTDQLRERNPRDGAPRVGPSSRIE